MRYQEFKEMSHREAEKILKKNMSVGFQEIMKNLNIQDIIKKNIAGLF